MMTQKKNIEKLLELINENPDLTIMPVVNGNIVGDDEPYGWWSATFGTASVEEFWCEDDRLYIKSDDFNELVEELYNNVKLISVELTDEEAEKEAEKIVNSYKWKKVIIIQINA